jgi:tetratricopeptide (TPR) repeat protein
MFQIEIDLATRRPNDLSAYDLCLRALSRFQAWTPSGSAEARRLASRALEIDPQQRSIRFARGYLIKGMGDFYEESGRKDEAIPLYRQSLDEFQLLVNPVALGQGTTLFKGVPGKVDFTLKGSRVFKSGAVMLVLEPV